MDEHVSNDNIRKIKNKFYVKEAEIDVLKMKCKNLKNTT